MREIKSRSFNIDAVLKLIILLGFALFFFITIRTGKVQLFVHPRIVPYLKFGIVAMLVMSMFLLEDVLKRQRKKVNISQYLFFIIPLIMAFSLPVKDISSSSMSFGNMNVSVSYTSSVNNNQYTDMSPIADGEIEDGSLILHGDTVVMDDNNFVKWVQEIYNNPSKYEGKKIKVTGFVFKGTQFKANEFVPARLMMVCCAADMSPIGLLAHYNNASELKQDSWFKFSGKIVKGEFNGQQTAVIDIESVEKTEKPENEYVYPY